MLNLSLQLLSRRDPIPDGVIHVAPVLGQWVVHHIVLSWLPLGHGESTFWITGSFLFIYDCCLIFSKWKGNSLNSNDCQGHKPLRMIFNLPVVFLSKHDNISPFSPNLDFCRLTLIMSQKTCAHPHYENVLFGLEITSVPAFWHGVGSASENLLRQLLFFLPQEVW